MDATYVFIALLAAGAASFITALAIGGRQATTTMERRYVILETENPESSSGGSGKGILLFGLLIFVIVAFGMN